jgi:hypothetical protein
MQIPKSKYIERQMVKIERGRNREIASELGRNIDGESWRTGRKFLTNHSNQDGYEDEKKAGRPIAKMVGLGLFSAASAVAGGLAVAWWYRKTLNKLQNPIADPKIQKMESDEDAEIDGDGLE